MFGYIGVNQPELKIKEYECYRSYYCGLCRQLKETYGITGQMTLTYDMTFLVILLTGLYEPETVKGKYRCLAHPLRKHATRINECTAYAADMNVILSYYKCKDDWDDEKKVLKGAYAKLLRRKMKHAADGYGKKLKRIRTLLTELNTQEKAGNTDLDTMAGLFGEILAEVFAWRHDDWEEELRRIGFYLGKFVYLCDAYEDVEEDVKKGTYNPLKERFRTEGFEAECRALLTMMISACCSAFEVLPIIENIEILRNILYSGVWYRYELVTEKRKREEEKR